MYEEELKLKLELGLRLDKHRHGKLALASDRTQIL